jgi:predicted nucleic acid-binding Zn finger protein
LKQNAIEDKVRSKGVNSTSSFIALRYSSDYCVTQTFCHCDEYLRETVKEEGFILVHGFRVFSL